MRTDLEKFREMVQLMERMVALDAPPTILAHQLVKLVIPRFVKVLGVTKEFGAVIGDMMARGLCQYSGTCTCCMKTPSVADDLCTKCLAEIDQFDRELDGMIENVMDEEDTEESHGVD